jgi:hypothetical protein
VKPPLGGATGLLTLPLLPQAARNRSPERARSRASALRSDITSPWERIYLDLVTF